VEFGAASDYIEAPAGDYQVRVTPAGTKTVAIDPVPVDAAGGGAPFDLLLLEGLN